MSHKLVFEVEFKDHKSHHGPRFVAFSIIGALVSRVRVSQCAAENAVAVPAEGYEVAP